MRTFGINWHTLATARVVAIDHGCSRPGPTGLALVDSSSRSSGWGFRNGIWAGDEPGRRSS
jgi:hypothetical protein